MNLRREDMAGAWSGEGEVEIMQVQQSGILKTNLKESKTKI